MMHYRKPFQRYAIDPDNILKILVIAVLTAVSFSGLFLYLLGIDLMNYLPTVSVCPFHAITGIPCPGCGMTRAMLSLGQLKLKAAIEFNLFSVPLLISMIIWLWPGKFPSFIQHRAFGIVMFVAIIFIWLMRLFGMQVI